MKLISTTDVATKDTFIGREHNISLLKKQILGESYPCVSIYGLPRIGKSSLVAEVVRILKDEKSGIETIYYQMPSDDTYYRFWKHIEKEILKLMAKKGIDTIKFKNKMKSLDVDDDDEIHDLIFEEIEVLRNNKIRLVLILDEFDSAREVFNKKSSRFKFLENLRGQNNMMTIILVSRLNVRELGYEKSDSRVDIKVEPFNDDEVKEFYSRLASNNIILSEDELDEFNFYCGKSPWLLCAMANALFNSVDEYGEIRIKEAFLDIENHVYELYDDIIDNLKAEELYTSFVQTFIGPKYSLKENAIRKMRARGYIVLKDKDGQIEECNTICKHFIEYVRKNDVPEKHNAWEVLGEAERILRKIIRNGYDEKYTENNGFAKLLQDVYSNNLIALSKYAIGTDEHHKKCKSFVANNISEYDDADILKAAAINELAKILNNHWAREIIFKKYFKNEDYSIWDPKFKVMNKARIPFAHNNFEFLKDSDIDKVNLYSNEIIEIEQDIELQDPKPIKGDFYTFENGKLIIKGIVEEISSLRNEQSALVQNAQKLKKGDKCVMKNIRYNTNYSNYIEGTVNGEKCIIYIDRLSNIPTEYVGKEILVEINRYNKNNNSYLVQEIQRNLV